MAKIDDYASIVGQARIDELKFIADGLQGKTIQHINSTAVGGGVAEILNRMIPLMEDLGLDVGWSLIKGGEKFFSITKKLHNALHGMPVDITDEEFEYYLEVEEENAKSMKFYGDIMIIHDPQPLGMVMKKGEVGEKWVWRCHIDVSNPANHSWDYLEKFVRMYDTIVFSSPAYSKKLPIKQILILPSIDPLSDKNKELSEEVINSVFEKYGIERDKPVITQISRYDFLKDPLGVIDAYRMVKKHIDCKLVLAGNVASDDPEHDKVFNAVKEKAGDDPDIHLLMIDPSTNDIDVNALQRGSDIILQKSIKEGFGLTVTEALWKGKPVVGSAIGGIPLQIKHNYSGLLCRSVEGAAFEIKKLLTNSEYARKLGENGREYVKNNFLITRHLRDYLLLCLSLYHKDGIIYLDNIRKERDICNRKY